MIKVVLWSVCLGCVVVIAGCVSQRRDERRLDVMDDDRQSIDTGDTSDLDNAEDGESDETDMLAHLRGESDPNRYILLSRDEELVLVDIKTKKDAGRIQTGLSGYTLLTANAIHQLGDYLILRNNSDKKLYRYTIADRSFVELPLSGAIDVGVDVIPSMTEYGHYLVHRWTERADDRADGGGDQQDVEQREVYTYDASTNTLAQNTTIRLPLDMSVTCLIYDSLNQRILIHGCGEGLGHTLPLLEIINGQSYDNATTLMSWADFPLTGWVDDIVPESYAVHESYGNVFVRNRSDIQGEIKIVMIYGAPVPGSQAHNKYRLFTIPTDVWSRAGIAQRSIDRIHAIRYLPQHNELVLGVHGGLVAMQYDEHGVAQQARMVQDDTILPYDILSDGSSVYVGAISARSASGSVVRMRDRRADSVYDGMPQWSGYTMMTAPDVVGA